jgi:hypothetical protein
MSDQNDCAGCSVGCPIGLIQKAGGKALESDHPTRQANRVLIENLNIHGQGTFSRLKATPGPDPR